MSQDAKSSVMCAAMLLLVATLTAGSLLLLKESSPAHTPTAGKMKPTPAVLPVAPTSEPPASATPQWDLEAWLRKPTPQNPSFSVMPVVEKKRLGIEVSVAF
jgi:hypothetical protein